MRGIIIITCLTLFYTSINAQSSFSNKKSNKHVEIPGTQIAISPPRNFELSSQFVGFQDLTSGSSLMIMQIPASFEKIKEGFTKDKMQTKGMELIDKVSISINGMIGELIQAKQFSAAHGYIFLKYTLILALEQNVTLMINGNYPESKKEEIGLIIKDALLSVYYDQNLKLDHFSALDFTVDLSKTKYKVQNSISGTILLDGGENGIIIIAKSIRPISSSDKKGASIQVLKAISTIRYVNLESSKEVKIDVCEGYQIVANVLKNNKPAKAIQTILFGENYYYNFTAIVPKYTKEILDDYEYILNSFKRK